MELDLASKTPRSGYSGDGGSYLSSSPVDLPMLRAGNIGAAKLELASLGFALPAYSDSAKVANVVQGHGACGIVLPDTPKEKVLPIKEGDVKIPDSNAIPQPSEAARGGMVLNCLEDPLVGQVGLGADQVVGIGRHRALKTRVAAGKLKCSFSRLLLLDAMPPEMIQALFNISPEMQQLLRSKSIRRPIISPKEKVLPIKEGDVKIPDSKAIPQPSEAARDGMVLNCLEDPLVGQVGLGADQVIGIDRQRVLKTRVAAGRLKCSSSRLLLLDAMPPEMIQALFNISPEMQQLLRSKSIRRPIISPKEKVLPIKEGDVKIPNSKAIPQPSEAARDGMVLNCLEDPLVGQVGLGADQVIGIDRQRVLKTRVAAGRLKCSSSRLLLLDAMPPEMIQALFNISPEMEQLLRSKSIRRPIISPPRK